MGTGRLGVVYMMSFHGDREFRCREQDGFHGDREVRCSVLYEFSWEQGG